MKSLNTEKRLLSVVFLLMAFFLSSGVQPAIASEIVSFGPKETKIEGSIPYSVIGKYKAHFKAFKGMIELDDQLEQIQSVDLKIKVASIASNCPWCDKLVRSRRLLNTSVYPEITFVSQRIFHDLKGYKVTGVLSMHGIKRQMTFPFKFKMIDDQKLGRRIMDIKGSWLINRKAFNIIWSRLLDRGGIVVGENLTVNWGIRIIVN